MRQLLVPATTAAVAALVVTAAAGPGADSTGTTSVKTARYVLENVERQPHRDIIRHDGDRVGYFVSAPNLVPNKGRYPGMFLHTALLPDGEVFIGGASRNSFDTEPTDAILGGTGAYKGARGEATVDYGGTINRLVIRLQSN